MKISDHDQSHEGQTELSCWVENDFLELLQFLADELTGGSLKRLLENSLEEYYKRHEEL